jgi:hypothetical protein
MAIKGLHPGFFFRHRIRIFMWALIAEMLASPLGDSHPRAGAVLGLSVLLMVLAGISQMANRRIVCRVVLPIAGLWMIARMLEAFGDRHEIYANLSPVAGLLFSCSILWAIFAHFRSEFRNPRSPISEAFISYLVIASGFGQLYWILNRFFDHAFNQMIPYTQNGTFLYFSMVTLTSVGYGGIVPLNPYVRVIAAFESMSGIFFIAVVVARLVSSYNPQTLRREHLLADKVASFPLAESAESETTAMLSAASSF